MHSSVSEMSHLMLEEVHRHNYVTPTNYLELVAGYKALLKEKHKELGDAATKLRNGLFKIDETRLKVIRISESIVERFVCGLTLKLINNLYSDFIVNIFCIFLKLNKISFSS